MRQLQQYDIILVDFGENNIGSEQSGKRPSVVVQNDTGNFVSPTTLVIPLTSSIKHINQPTHALIAKGYKKGLTRDSMLLGECLRQISKERIIKYLGRITNINEKEAVKKVYYANMEGCVK